MLRPESERDLTRSNTELSDDRDQTEGLHPRIDVLALLADGRKTTRSVAGDDSGSPGKSEETRSSQKDLSKASIRDLFTMLGGSDVEQRRLAQKELERWNVSIKPEDLIEEVKKPTSGRREGVLTALEGFYGIPREHSENGAKLGAGIYADREDAERYFEDCGARAIPLVASLTHSRDAEIAARAERLMNKYLATEPISELGKHREILAFLPQEDLNLRWRAERSWEGITRMGREVALLRLFPEHVQQRIDRLTHQGGLPLESQSVDLRQEIQTLRDLPALATSIEVALSNLSVNQTDKQMHLIRAMEVNPLAAKQRPFVWACEQAHVFENARFCRAFVRHGGDPSNCTALVSPKRP